MSVDFAAFSKHEDGVYRYTPGTEGFRVNLANGNAYQLLMLLGLDVSEPCGCVSVPEFRKALLRASNTDPAPYTREESDTKPPGKCRMISFGIDESYIERRLQDLWALAQAATEMQADEISWG